MVTITELSDAKDDQSISDIESSHEVFKIVLDNTSGQEQYLLLEGKPGLLFKLVCSGSVQGILVTHIHEGVISKFASIMLSIQALPVFMV